MSEEQLFLGFNTAGLIIDPDDYEIDEEDFCVICRGIPCSPYRFGCDHLICMKCIKTGSKMVHCPCCDAELDSPPKQVTKRAAKRILALCGVIHCPYHIKCSDQERIQVYSLRDHLLKCQHARILCPNCNHVILRGALKEHLAKECECRLQPCAKCDIKVRQKDMDKHCREKHMYCSVCKVNYDQGDTIHSVNNCRSCDNPIPNCQMAAHYVACIQDRGRPDREAHKSTLTNALRLYSSDQQLQQVQRRLSKATADLPPALQRFGRHGPFLRLSDGGRQVGKLASDQEELVLLSAAVSTGVHSWVLDMGVDSFCRVGVAIPDCLIASVLELPYFQQFTSGTIAITIDPEAAVIAFEVEGHLQCCRLPPAPHTLAVVLSHPDDWCRIISHKEVDQQKRQEHADWFERHGPAMCGHLRASAGLNLSEDATVGRGSGDSWMCVTTANRGLNWGVHSWRVRVVELGQGVSVGVCCPESLCQDQQPGSFSGSLALDHTGKVRSNGSEVGEHWRIHQGHFIDVTLDLQRRTLSLVPNLDESQRLELHLPSPLPCGLALGLRRAQVRVESYTVEEWCPPPVREKLTQSSGFVQLGPFLGHCGSQSVVGKLRAGLDEAAVLLDAGAEGVYDFDLHIHTDSCSLAFLTGHSLASHDMDGRFLDLPAGKVSLRVAPTGTLHVRIGEDILVIPRPEGRPAVVLSKPGDVCELLRSVRLTESEASALDTLGKHARVVDCSVDPTNISTVDGHALIACRHCHEGFAPVAWIAHSSKCPERPVRCPHCTSTPPCLWEGTADALESHHTGCYHSLVTCPGCSEEILRGELEEHQRECLDDCMILEFEIDGSCSLVIPCQDHGQYDAVIDWGDENSSSVRSWNDSGLRHSYSSAGIYTVRIRGSFPSIYFNDSGDKDKLVRIIQLGATGLQKLNRAFYGCSRLREVERGNCDLSQVTNMNCMFYSCGSLTALDCSGWDTSQVTKMNWMFCSCGSLTALDCSGWDTSQVTDMDCMFHSCTSLRNLVKHFDMSRASTSSMFHNSLVVECLCPLQCPGVLMLSLIVGDGMVEKNG